MEAEKLIKSSQEQAVASWINYLNQVRLNELVEALSKQVINFTEAIETIDDTFETIQRTIIERNRGGVAGMHGFIAEIAECGIGNARQLIEGKAANYVWVNDNGPVDLIRDGIEIQQKFVNSGGHLSLRAISEHLARYPDYIKNGGAYQIPKEHYEKIKYLFDMPKEVADKIPTTTGEFSLKQWKEVHQFFESGEVKFKSLEPSALSYDSVQVNRIEETIEIEKTEITKTDELKREAAYNESLPTLKEGLKATIISGAIEGGTAFCMGIVKKRKSGKQIKEFDESDWKDIAGESGKGFIKGSIRGVSIYTLANFTATPAAVASAIVTASFGVAEQAHLLREGKLDEVAFIENSELLCLDASISALSSFIGQAVIPVPVLGAVIGNTIGTVMYQIGKDKFSEKEQTILREYSESLRQLDENLQEKYQHYILRLTKEVETFMTMIEGAFSTDVNIAFEGSLKLASELGVPVEEILDTPEKVKSYFMD